MEIDVFHHWAWLRPLFIAVLVGTIIALAAIVGWLKRQREKRTGRARTRLDAGRGRIRSVSRNSGNTLESRWQGPSGATKTSSKQLLRRVAVSHR